MILKVGTALVTIAAGVAGYLLFEQQAKKQCGVWLTSAETNQSRGYFADSIKDLTVYFSEDRCRGSDDPQAIRVLADARLAVPLPDNAHMSQQLMLAKLGWTLKRDEKFSLMEASSQLIKGDWLEARRLAEKATGTQAALVGLTASLRLNDQEMVEVWLDKFSKTKASDYQWALLTELLNENPMLLKRHSDRWENINIDTKEIAALSVRRFGASVDAKKLRDAAKGFSDDDLARATSLMTAEGNGGVAMYLLDQPDRPMPSSLLIRHARLLWAAGNYAELQRFLTRRAKRSMPGEVHMIVCLAQIQSDESCTLTFDKNDYERRHGVYAANRWNTLLRELSKQSLDVSATLNAITNMKDLLAQSAIAQQLTASLYTAIGENDLAARYTAHANILGLEKMDFPFTKNLRRAPADRQCELGQNTCTADFLRANIGDFSSWSKALENGFQPDTAMLSELAAVSPKEAILWRTATAQAAIKEGSDKSFAYSLRLLRPTLRWAPNRTITNLMASAGSHHFGDEDATFSHLATVAKNDPEATITVLRLSLGYYKSGSIRPPVLAHWWQAITRLEMKARNISASDPRVTNLLVERITLLAAIGEQSKDTNLAMASYQILLEETPENHMALNNLAVHYYRKKENLSQAWKMASRAIELAPGQTEYVETLEDISAELERRELAGV